MTPPATDSPEASGSINLAAALGALRRRKRAILASLLAVNAAAVALVLLLPPRYTATATVAVESGEARALETRPVAKGIPVILPGDSSVIATQVNVLRSQALATQVVVALGLDRDPPPPTVKDRLAGLIRNWLPESWRATLGLGDDPARMASPDAVRQAAVGRFLDRLSVGLQGESRIIAVSFTAGTPDQAARVANKVVAAYLDGQLAAKAESTARTLRWAEARVAQLRQDLLDTEATVTEYMAANGLVAAEGGLDRQQLTVLQGEVAAARAARATNEVKLGQLRELARHPGGTESLPEVGNSRLITALQQEAATLRIEEAQLSLKYGSEHLRVLQVKNQRNVLARKIADEIGTIARSVENEARLAGGREQALEGALAQGKEQYAAAERASLHLRELTREASAKRTMYEALLTRTNEIKEQGALLEPDARVISEAVAPVEASFPKTGIVLGAGFVGSLALGIMLAALREHLDQGLRTSRQIEQLLGLPNLGVVPKIRPGRGRNRRYETVLARPQSSYAEAMRAIGTMMQVRSAKPPKVIMVTSSLPGEGKTTLAASLGTAIARTGRRVVVVDLDLRHPTMARELEVAADAGVVELLTGKLSLDDVLLVHPYVARLHVLPTRRPSTRPGDLLLSPNLRPLIEDLRLRYDFVILDLPPTLGLSDVQTVGSLADAVLLVVRWGATSAEAAVNAVETLARAGIAVTGTALTQVNLRRHSLYDYKGAGQYYKAYRSYFKD